MKKDNLILLGLAMYLITISIEKKHGGFSIVSIFLNVVAFSMSLMSFIYSIWCQKVYDHTSKLFFACLIQLIASAIISKYICITALLGYIGSYLYYSRKKIKDVVEINPEYESYLMVFKKNKIFFTKIPFFIIIGLYSSVVLIIWYKILSFY